MDELWGFDGAYRATVSSGQVVTCLVCSGERFAKRRVKLNTGAMTFFGLDWANVGSQGLGCLSCGYIMQFAENTVALETA